MSEYDPEYFVEISATHPGRLGDPLCIVARISDGAFVKYPRELPGWTSASNFGELLRDGFTLVRTAS